MYFDFKNFNIKLISKNFYKLIITPININYSETFSNILRKLLFTSSTGYSITELKFYNLLHEYDNFIGVKEDTLNIILNFKELILRLKKKKSLILIIKKEGPCVLRGSDIKNKYLEVLNPNKAIASLSCDSKFKVKIKVEKGEGFIPYSSKNIKKKKSFNGILLDVCFCPIISVFYYIEVIENLKHFNRIIFYIKTNGSLNIISNLKKILKKFFRNMFFVFNKKKNYKKKFNLNLFEFFNFFENKFSLILYYFLLNRNLFKINFNKLYFLKFKEKFFYINFLKLKKKKIFKNYIKIYEA